ncbi:Rep [uncultured virus]|uniref:ATP-dependent helicase Rep n=1 Tax=uncultured virus TaxID=340016 RepID=A0A2K9LS12_9VIRU|nr:Rep [uncultured virus]
MSTPKNQKSYNWVFTSWDASPPQFDSTKMKYLCFEQETCPTTGKQHWQGFVGFKNQIRMNSVIKNLDCTTHPYVAIMRGSLKDNEKYCSKEKGFTKFGNLPEQGKRTDILTVSQMVRDGLSDRDIINTIVSVDTPEGPKSIDYGEKWRHNYKGIQALRHTIHEQKRNWVMDVRIYWGEPETGKTSAVYDEFKEEDVYAKPPGKYWDHYAGEPVVLIDDFDPLNCYDCVYDYYLRLLDRYKMLIEYKGGMMQFYSKTIIITSNFDPATWFTEKKNRAAFFRRVTQIRHFPQDPGLALASKLGKVILPSPNFSLCPPQKEEEEIFRLHEIICENFQQEYEEW